MLKKIYFYVTNTASTSHTINSNLFLKMNLLKRIKVVFLFLTFPLVLQAQTAQEIIDTYIENIGGHDAWSKIESMTAKGIGKQQGVEYPFVATYMADGRYLIEIDIQGTPFVVEAFDGETSWAMNFQTQKPEAQDSESSLNTKNEAKDLLVSPFFNYKEKGYAIELVSKETMEGTEAFKIKLTKKPTLSDGEEKENIEFFFFDTENYVPIASESTLNSGPAQGMTSQSIYSDFQEINGLYLPFSQIDKFNGQIGLEVLIETAQFNTEVDETIFKMPQD